VDEVPVKMPERVTIKRVRIPFAECLRFPGEGKSTQGKSDPNTRPKGVVDGWRVNIPALDFLTNPVTPRLGRTPCQLRGGRKAEDADDSEVVRTVAEKSRSEVDESDPY
jgi:hypothetical protein